MSTKRASWESVKEWAVYIGALVLFFGLVGGSLFYGCAREYMEWKTMRAIQHGAKP